MKNKSWCLKFYNLKCHYCHLGTKRVVFFNLRKMVFSVNYTKIILEFYFVTVLLLVIIHFRSTNLTHAQMIESHADFASDVTILFNNNLF
jgi:hypothetical protein